MSCARALVAIALTVVALLATTGSGGAASSPVVVSMTVTSATTIVPGACVGNLPNVTAFGAIQPGTGRVMTGDCTIEFGSSNDSSLLRAYQTDNCQSVAHTCAASMGSDSVAPQAAVGTTTQVRDGHFSNASVGWLVGYSNQVKYTSDAGATWSNRNTGLVGGTINSIAYVSGGSGAEVLVLVGGNGWIRRSVDGGASWSTPTYPATAGSFLDVAIEPGGTGWAVGQAGLAYRTADGGSTWTDVTAAMQACTGTGNDVNSVVVLSPTNALVVGISRDCRTTDGTAWADSTMPVGVSATWSVDVANSGAALWAVGYNDTVYRSIDAGTSWVTRPTGIAGARHRAVYAVDALHAWVVGYEETVLETVDGGLTWRRVQLAAGSTNNYYGIAGAGSNVWVVGNHTTAANRVLASPSVFISDYLNAGGGTDRDWSSDSATTSMFGICLRSVSNGAATDGTTWAADSDTIVDEPAVSADCGDGDDDPWRAVPMNDAVAGKVATAAGSDVDARAHLRLGLRIGLNQTAGTYLAPITFEVLAPNA